LAIFNLVPIPPLDGSKIFIAVLPHKYSLILQRIGLQSMFLILLLLFFFPNVIWYPATAIFQLFVGNPGTSSFLGVFGQ